MIKGHKATAPLKQWRWQVTSADLDLNVAPVIISASGTDFVALGRIFRELNGNVFISASGVDFK